jgi:hypothetical protein
MSEATARELNVIPEIPLTELDREINRRAFIRLWTLTTGTADYVKQQWLDIERQLDRANLI